MRRTARLVSIVLLVVLSLTCEITAPEEERVVLYVGPERVECTGVGPRTCLLVKEDPEDEWTLFYDAIEGFEYEPGFTYKLLVSRRTIPKPSADASSIAWRLIEVLEKIRS